MESVKADTASPLRIGFVGCGRHGAERIYPSLSSAGLQLIATCDLDRERAKLYARRFAPEGRQIPTDYSDHREMCESEELDAVLVVTGPQGHYQITREIVEVGLPVWEEKPPAPTAAQALDVAVVAEKAGVHVQVGFNYRYTAGVRRARALIDSGKFSTPRSVAVRWWLGDRDGSHYVEHYLCHAIDLLAYLTGGLDGMHVHKAEGEDCFYYLATFHGRGCTATLEASNNMYIGATWCRIDWLGKSGLLTCDGFEELSLTPGKEDAKKAEGLASGAITRWVPPGSLPRAESSLHERWGYVPELRLFAATVRGEAEPESTIAEAAEAMRISEEIVSVKAS